MGIYERGHCPRFSRRMKKQYCNGTHAARPKFVNFQGPPSLHRHPDSLSPPLFPCLSASLSLCLSLASSLFLFSRSLSGDDGPPPDEISILDTAACYQATGIETPLAVTFLRFRGSRPRAYTFIRSHPTRLPSLSSCVLLLLPCFAVRRSACLNKDYRDHFEPKSI